MKVIGWIVDLFHKENDMMEKYKPFDSNIEDYINRAAIPNDDPQEETMGPLYGDCYVDEYEEEEVGPIYVKDDNEPRAVHPFRNKRTTKWIICRENNRFW